MRKTVSMMIGAAGLSMALAACGGAEEAAETTEETAEAEEVVAPEEFIVDRTGQLAQELGDTMMEAINVRLAAYFAETGNNVQILIVDTTEGEDMGTVATAAMAEAGSDAMIYIAAGDQEIGVVGEGIDADEGEQIANNMADAFDNENFEGGFMDGIEATATAMAS